MAPVLAKSIVFRLADIMKLSRHISSRFPRFQCGEICQSPQLQPLAFFLHKCFMDLLCHAPIVPYGLLHSILSDGGDEFIALECHF